MVECRNGLHDIIINGHALYMACWLHENRNPQSRMELHTGIYSAHRVGEGVAPVVVIVKVAVAANLHPVIKLVCLQLRGRKKRTHNMPHAV